MFYIFIITSQFISFFFSKKNILQFEKISRYVKFSDWWIKIRINNRVSEYLRYFRFLRRLSSRRRGKSGKWEVQGGRWRGVLPFSLPLLLLHLSLIFILCRCMKIFPRNHPRPVDFFICIRSSATTNRAGRADNQAWPRMRHKME